MQFLYRALVAVIVALGLFAILPPVLNILQINASGDLMTIFRVVIGFGCLIYIIRGPNLPLPG